MEAQSDTLEYLVASQVPERFIDSLEAIQINPDDGKGFTVARRSGSESLGCLQTAIPVQESREGIYAIHDAG